MTSDINLADDRIGPNLFCEPDPLLANWATHECFLPGPKEPTDPVQAAAWRRALTEEAITEAAAGLRAFLRNCKSKNNRLLGRVSKAYKDELRILSAYLADGAPAAPWNDYPEPPAAVPGWTNVAREMREQQAEKAKRLGRCYFGRREANQAPEMFFAKWVLNPKRSNDLRACVPPLRRLLAEVNLLDKWIAEPLLRGNRESLAGLPPHLVFSPERDDRTEGVNDQESRRLHTIAALQEATKALRTFLQDCSWQNWRLVSEVAQQIKTEILWLVNYVDAGMPDVPTFAPPYRPEITNDGNRVRGVRSEEIAFLAGTVAAVDPLEDVEFQFARCIIQPGWGWLSDIEQAPAAARPLLQDMDLRNEYVCRVLGADVDPGILHWPAHLVAGGKVGDDQRTREELTWSAIQEATQGIRKLLKTCEWCNRRMLDNVAQVMRDELARLLRDWDAGCQSAEMQRIGQG